MKKYILLLFCAFIVEQVAGQQNVEFNKDNFKQNLTGYREAKKKLDAGDDIFAATSKKTDDAYRKKNYRNAIAPYLDAHTFNPNSAILNYRLGVSYLFSEEKKKALVYLEKARKLNPAVDPEVGFYLGKAHQVNVEWQKAITEYKKYLSTLPSAQNKEKIEIVNKSIRECLSGESLQKKPLRVFIDNAGEEINGPYADFNPVISADESVMVFASRRPADQEAKAKVDKQPNDDLYISTKVAGKWSTAKQMPEAVNTEKDEIAVALSPDGQRLLLYREENDGDLYESVLKGTEWSKAEEVSKEINSSSRESSATYSYDGKTLYFVSNRPNGIGKGDIYYSVQDSKGNWGKAINAGPKINTAYEEADVFLMPDGKTLYFSSEGHTSMGGFDLFKSVYENGQWSEPENLGFPVNTPDDDQFLTVSANGRFGYYATNRLENGKGEKDIYKITFTGPEKPMILTAEEDVTASTELHVVQPVVLPNPELKTPQSLLLSGIITDAKTQKPLEAKIEVIDNMKQEVVATFLSNSFTGKYLVSLPAGKNYGVAVKKDNYLFHSENFTLPANAAFSKVDREVRLQALEANSSVPLRNIFFAEGQAAFLPESTYELNGLVELLKDKRSLSAEIAVSPEKGGDSVENIKLAQSRAKALIDYLVTKGINVKRLQAKAGEMAPNSKENETASFPNSFVKVTLIGK